MKPQDKQLPSIRLGLFHYMKPFSRANIAKEIQGISSKYSFDAGSLKTVGLNYLFTNSFITLDQVDLLAKDLCNWKGRIVSFTRDQEGYSKESEDFTHDHMDALIALVQDQRVPMEIVVDRIQLLTPDQARMIANGRSREGIFTDNLSQSMGLR